MASGRDIRRRIRSIGSTAQITRAMQMVAASKMRKAQQLAIEARPFTRELARMQRVLIANATEVPHPLMEKRDVKKRAVVLVSSDKGLCGSLNSNLFRLVSRYETDTTVFIAAGRKGAQFLARTRRQLVAEFKYGDTPSILEARSIAAMTRNFFLKGEVDSVHVLASEFVNTLVQRPVVLDLLPIGDLRGIEIPGAPRHETGPIPKEEYLFEPNAPDIVDYLLGHYLNIVVYLTLVNAKASEQSARMVSMKGATDNANEMIKDLTLEYNKLRQGRITQELLEIAGGQAG
jgi:F-type H+-transporting ATPase subunit gamma